MSEPDDIVSPVRRLMLAGLASTVVAPASWAAEPACQKVYQLEALERQFGGQLGIWLLDQQNAEVFRFRANQRFAFCSTFKVMLCAAVLASSPDLDKLLSQKLAVTARHMVSYSPVTEKFIGRSMSIGELCAAALQYSDNSAANLLIRWLGGVAKVNAFARSRGDHEFRLDRIETELNSALPGDPRDTSTPEAMGRSLLALTLGDGLAADASDRLCQWLKGNTTGNARIRAGLPTGWQCGDKTGTGDYGSANDIAVIWPPARQPLVLAIYTRRQQATDAPDSDIIAAATRIVLGDLS